MENSKQGKIDFFDYWLVIRRHKKMIAIIMFLAVTTAVIYSLLTPQIWRADTIIIPVGGGGGSSGLAALASQFSGVPLLGTLGGMKSHDQKLLAILNSRTLAENIVEKHDLIKDIFRDKWNESTGTWKEGEEIPTKEEAVDELRGFMTFSQDLKGGTITVSADFYDPAYAAQIANWYVEGLQDLINKNSFTVAKRNRIFIEEQLVQNKGDLFKVGKEINEFYKGGRVSDVRSRVDVLLGAQNEYNFGKADLIAHHSSNSEDLWHQIEDKKTQLKEKLQQASVIKDVPQQVYLQYLTLRRELLGKINALLTQQYEMAKIEEAKEDLAFQVIDPAISPLIRFKPRRKQIVMLAFCGSLAMSIFLVFFIEYLKKIRKEYKIRISGEKL